ncbi:globin domain-containing protein [Arthrobacter sp. zg-Y1219]|uniref:globin domain-containing protein n=1 Tax=Arthrobacter sp. zg-Y1219 TaxID=3049067 RepID=UPI0024C2EEF2|nr:globin domain-containing protein [Arthrobacter sp. zg-Y1219]MDK1361381.1 globin domain-containing protein [Arthrobacter sp. zg-Y1219]
MLSDTSRPVIEATLPVVGGNIAEIAKRFYAHMFAEKPELLDGLFNRGNQANGQQQQALAGSVAAFAGFLVNRPDELPDHLLARIAHKHVSLGLRPEQYKVVHDHLMWAIVDVLGDAVTPDVAAAWDEVYWLMANVLINSERVMYAAAGLDPESVWRPWRVTEKIAETDDVVTFVVERTDDRNVEPSLPGQYISLKALMPDGVHQPRQYSLTRADDGLHRQFSVKRIHGLPSPDGEVSNLLHASVNVGDELVLSAPFGEVVLKPADRPVVFISAGIGITPMAGMISHLAQSAATRSVTLLHADHSAASFALQNQMRADLAQLPDASMLNWFMEPSADATPSETEFTGFMDLTNVELPADSDYYLCGPLAFMQAIRSSLIVRGVPAQDIQYEVFGPDLWLADVQ